MQERIYYKDNYLTEFDAKVMDCINDNGLIKVVLNDTAFYPEGGGQKADIGKIDDVNVIDVQEKNGIVYHTVDKEIEIGKEVKCKVDFETRFSNMQHHTAEHIVSGLVCSKYNAENVGFHMGKDAVTIDFNVLLNKEQLMEIEQLSNEAVFKNVPIKVTNYTKEEASKIKYRSKKELEGIIRIVEIPGYDICACCGIHVARTGEIGIIKLLDVEKYKSGCRVSLLCGKKALGNYNNIYNQIDETSTLLSVKHNEIIDNVKELLDKNNELKHQNLYLKYQMFDMEISNKNIDENQFIVKEKLEPSEMKVFCTKLQDKALDISGVFSKENDELYRFQIMSKKSDLKPLAQRMISEYNGKGGGSNNLIQGQLNITDEQVNEIIDKNLLI